MITLVVIAGIGLIAYTDYRVAAQVSLGYLSTRDDMTLIAVGRIRPA